MSLASAVEKICISETKLKVTVINKLIYRFCGVMLTKSLLNRNDRGTFLKQPLAVV